MHHLRSATETFVLNNLLRLSVSMVEILEYLGKVFEFDSKT